ncbi:MAG TPA: delta-60 repeat domain-containing protein [Opitutaceae bacterium]
MISFALPLLRALRVPVLAALASAVSVHAAADVGFDPNANGNIYATLIQPDGKVVIGGSFTTLQPGSLGAPVSRTYVARLTPDGALDESFHPVLNGDVSALALEADGSLLVGGKFTQAQTDASGTAYPRNGVVRIRADGTVDPAFNPYPNRPVNALAAVQAIAVQSDGRIILGGSFTTLQPNQSGDPVSRQRLARVHADGSVDGTFDPRANNVVFALALQPDGKILAGGGFTTLQPNGAAASTSVRRLARLNTDGSLDTAFAVALDNRVLDIALEADGGILIAGDFTTVQGTTDSSAVERYFLARLSKAGALDSTFNPLPNAVVSSLAVQRDGKILAGGNFTTFHAPDTGVTVTRPYFARLTRAGLVDTSFAPGANAAVAAISLHPDGRIVIGGYFSRLQPSGATAAILRNRVARVQPTGALDSAFASEADGLITAVAETADGSLLVGGLFSSFAGVTRHNLARVLADGTVDAAFAPVLNGQVLALVVQSDGKILLGGTFTEINDTERYYIARLNADGSLDTNFDPKANSSISALLLQSDGKILVGGSFTSFLPNDAETAVARTYLALLNADGTVADGWTNGAAGTVLALARQASGKLLVGHSAGINRYNTDGSVDTDFKPTPNSAVTTIALQSDDKIVIGGTFTILQLDDGEADDDDADGLTDDDANRAYIARLGVDGSLDKTFNPTFNASVTRVHVLPDGKLLVGGVFTTLQPNGAEAATTREKLVRLNTDGTLDEAFTLQANDTVRVLLAHSDSSLFVGGELTSLYSASGASIAAPSHLARLAADGTPDASWQPHAAGSSGRYVTAFAQQVDGRTLVGGNFAELAGGTTTHLARLAADGSPDTAFDTSADNTVRAVLVQRATFTSDISGNTFAWLEPDGSYRPGFSLAAVAQLSGRVNAVAAQADGKLLLGGSFTDRSGRVSGNLIRLHTDGSLDTSFNPAPSSSVSALVLQPDGRILVAGAFTTIAGTSRTYIARLEANGALDASFVPTVPNSTISAVALQSDGRILVGGSFTAWEVNDGEGDDDDGDGTTNDDTGRTYFARLNADGTFDSTYKPFTNGSVTAILLQPDGKILLGGGFTSVTGQGGTSASNPYIARLNADGSVDTAFNPTPNGAVSSLALQADGKILFGGSFSILQLDDGESDDDDGDDTTTDDADRYYLARVNADGTLDKTFKPTPNSSVATIGVQSDGHIVIGGSFTTLTPNGAETATTRNHLARLNADGTLDTAFNPNANDLVYTVLVRSDDSLLTGGAFTALQPDSPIVVAGDFGNIGGTALPYLARLNVDGNPDSSFSPAPDAPVFALAEQVDGRVLAGGAFTTIAGQSRTRLARFHADGELDGSFAPSIDGTVTAVAIASDSTILIGGEFGSVGARARTRLARLAIDGTVDASFDPSANDAISAIVPMPDGRILVAGRFTHIAGAARSYLARLNADGSLDPTFAPGPNGPVHALAPQADGTVLVAGEFTEIAGTARARVARLASDGSLDATFAASATDAVYALALTPDGRPLLGGAFTHVDGTPRYLVARLGNATDAGGTFAVTSNLDRVTWTRTGSAAQLSAVTFAVSTDGNNWTPLGAAARMGSTGSWTWHGTVASPDTNYFVRARAIAPTNRYGSGGVVEAVWQFYNTTPAGYGYASSSTSDGGTGGDGDDDGDGDDSGGDDGSTGGGSGSTDKYVNYGDLANSPAVTPISLPDTGHYFINLSTRVNLSGDEIFIMGFIISGTGDKRVLLRAAGPSLTYYGVDRVAGAPTLALYDNAGNRLLTNEGWGGDAALCTLFAQSGAFPFDLASVDAAIAVTLPPGAYTIHVRDRYGLGGTVLTEVYDVGTEAQQPQRLINLSGRGTSATGEGVFIGGFVLGGDEAHDVLVRGLGPELTKFGVTGPIPDPTLTLYNVASTVIASNDDWATPVTLDPAYPAGTASEVADAMFVSGASSLATDAKDSALLLNMQPGLYTLHIGSKDGNAGVSMIEIFEVP